MISKHKKLLLLLALISVLIAIPLAKVNAAATITVNSTADNQSNDGACTLREAIVASNTDTASGVAVGECVAGSGSDTIEFDISGTGLKTIHISTGLPSITQTVTIDGYTQTDAVVNTADFPNPMNGTLTVEIDAEGESGIYGIDINGSGADGTVIKGLIVNDIPYETFYLTDVDNVSIEGNYIGTNPDGEVEAGFGNAGVGVVFLGLAGVPSNNILGGSATGAGNIIAGNQAGVIVFSVSGTDPINNTIVGNSIHDNDGHPSSSLGIDLLNDDTGGDFTPDEDVGVHILDPGDVDEGPNDYLNYPVINSTSATAGSLDVNFDLDVDGTAPNGYRVDFYANSTADASGNGEGEIYLGHVDVDVDFSGQTATLAIPSTFTSGSYSITATTTEKDDSDDGFGATSEFAVNKNNQTITANQFTEVFDVPNGWGVPPPALMTLARTGADAGAAPNTQTTISLRNAPSTSFNPSLDALPLAADTDISVHETGSFSIDSTEDCPSSTPVTVTIGNSTSTTVAMSGLEPAPASNNSSRAVFDLSDSSVKYLSVSENSSTGDVWNHLSGTFTTTFGNLENIYVVSNVQVVEDLIANPPNGSQASTSESIPTIGLTYDSSGCNLSSSVNSTSDDSLADTGSNQYTFAVISVVLLGGSIVLKKKYL